MTPQRGAGLIAVLDDELCGWEVAKKALATAKKQQQASLAAARSNLLNVVSVVLRNGLLGFPNAQLQVGPLLMGSISLMVRPALTVLLGWRQIAAHMIAAAVGCCQSASAC